METIHKLLSEPKLFESWLDSESTKHNQVVGLRGMPAYCPLATFLTQAGLESGVCAKHIVIYNAGNVNIKINTSEIGDWIAEFVCAIDKTDSIEVKAATALEVLSSIKIKHN